MTYLFTLPAECRPARQVTLGSAVLGGAVTITPEGVVTSGVQVEVFTDGQHDCTYRYNLEERWDPGQ